MEIEKISVFPWLKDVIHDLSTSFLVDYNNDTLLVLHCNIDEEIKKIYSNEDESIKRAEALYKEIAYLYEHMRLKIIQHSDFQNTTLSCVKLVSQLIKVGLVLTQGFINSEWIERILTTIKLFPGNRKLMYDAVLLVNGLRKTHRKPYCAILRHIMTEDYHEFVTDPLVYMEIILLFRRLKALVLNKYKEKYTLIVTKIKPPSNFISWLASLDTDDYSYYLKKLRYKKIALQLMNKSLPESFLKKIRYMILSKYNFEIGDNNFKIIEIGKQPSDMFIIDNISSKKCDNLDILINSQKAITRKIKTQKKKKNLQVNENNPSKKSNYKTKAKNMHINEFGINITNHKNVPNSNKHVIVSKKKIKSKHNINKNTKTKKSKVLKKAIPDNDSCFQNFEYSNTLEQLNKNIKHFPNTSKCKIISKKKKKPKHSLVKNTKVNSSTIDDEHDSTLFFYDFKGNTALKTLKNVCVSNSTIPKRNFNEDTDSNTTVKSILQMNRKKLKSSENDEKTFDDYLSKNKNNKSDNLFREDAKDVFKTDIDKKKRKNNASKDDSASLSDKCTYFKKLRLKRVNESFPVEVLNELESKNSTVTIEDNFKILDGQQTNKNATDNFIENIVHESSVEFITNQNAYPNNLENENFREEKSVTEDSANASDEALNIDTDRNSIPLKDNENLPEDNLMVQSSEKIKFIMKQKVSDESTLEISTVKESSEKIMDKLNSKFEKANNITKKPDVSSHLNDIIVTSVSDVQCENIENKYIFKESGYHDLKSVSINEDVLLQDSNEEIHTHKKDKSNSVSLSNMTDEVLNQNQHVSIQGTGKAVSNSSISVNLNECENHINVISSEDFSDSSEKKNLCSIVLKEFTVKTKLELENTKIFSETEIQKNISFNLDNVSHPKVLDSKQSEHESLIIDVNEQNIVSSEYTTENSSNVNTESKSEIKTCSVKIIDLDVSHEDDALIYFKNENTEENNIIVNKTSDNSILCSIDQDKDLQTEQSIVNNQQKFKKCIDISTEYAENSSNQFQHDYVHFDNDEGKEFEEDSKFKGNILKCEASENLNNKGKSFVSKNSDLDIQFEQNKLSNGLSLKTILHNNEDSDVMKESGLKNIDKKGTKSEINSKTALRTDEKNEISVHIENNNNTWNSDLSSQESSKNFVDKKYSSDVDQNSNQFIGIDSPNAILIKEENTERNAPIISSCLDGINISVNNVKINTKEEENNQKILIKSEKAASTCEKLEKIIDVSSKNILSLNESVCSDNINNSMNYVGIKVEVPEKTFHSLSESEELIDASANSDQSNTYNYQSDSTISKKRNSSKVKTLSLNESTCSGTTSNSINDAKILTKNIIESLQLPIESKNTEETLLNSETEKSSHQIESVLKKEISDISIENCLSEIDSKISSESTLTDIKKSLLMVVDDVENSLTYSKKIFTSSVPVMKIDCFQHETEPAKELEIKCTDVNDLIIKKTPLKSSEPIFLHYFCDEKKYESFSEISFKNKNKMMNLESMNSVPIDNFTSAASTELFSMYRNELVHDEDKTDTSSSKNDILFNYLENEEVKSQCFSSNHSDDDDDDDSRSSSQEENKMHKEIFLEDFNVPSKNTDEVILYKNDTLPNSKAESDANDDEKRSQGKNISNASVENAYEKTSNVSILPRQSLRLKNKMQSKNEENSSNDISKAQESCKKEIEVVLTDCKSDLKTEKILHNIPIENKSNCSLTLENNKNICYQASVSEKNLSKSKCKPKENSASCKTSDKRYSLRRHKSNQSRDDSANLGIDLNKLKFDSPTSKHTRSRKESKFVKLLTSHVKSQDNSKDEIPVKRETRSSVAKSDVETEASTPSYNLRNRKLTIAPSKLKI